MPLPTIYYKKLDNPLLAPIKANPSDSGYDIFAHSGPRVVGKMADNHGQFWSEILYIEYGTNLFVEHEETLSVNDRISYLQLYPRSSISKYNLVLANSCGIIDNTYNLEILVRFKYLPQPEDCTIDNGRVFVTINTNKIYQVGNKIAQIIPSVVSQVNFVEVEKITESSRGGFGSSGL